MTRHSLTSLTCRTCRRISSSTGGRGLGGQLQNSNSNNSSSKITGRRFMNSSPSSSKPASSSTTSTTTKPTEEGPPPTLQNISLASALAGFSFFVFTYSMNAVGSPDTDSTNPTSDGSTDPLAQLKEEAKEARQRKEKDNARKLSPDEIAALESGISSSSGAAVELAVAAPADIAQMEEEANMKVFQQKQKGNDEASKKKKPWWRFGF